MPHRVLGSKLFILFSCLSGIRSLFLSLSDLVMFVLTIGMCLKVAELITQIFENAEVVMTKFVNSVYSKQLQVSRSLLFLSALLENFICLV